MFFYYNVKEWALPILEKKKLKKLKESILVPWTTFMEFNSDPPGTVADTSMKSVVTNAGFLMCFFSYKVIEHLHAVTHDLALT